MKHITMLAWVAMVWSAEGNAARRGMSELFAKLLHTSNERAPRCVGATPVPAARAAIVARLIAAHDRKPPVPLVVQRCVHVFNDAVDEARDTNVIDDFSALLAAGMRWWIELPHVDRPFIRLASALPGYVVP